MLRRLFLLTTLATTLTGAAALPYVESVDAKAAVEHALAAAKIDKVPVLVIFGANWCEDCRPLRQTYARSR